VGKLADIAFTMRKTAMIPKKQNCFMVKLFMCESYHGFLAISYSPFTGACSFGIVFMGCFSVLEKKR
jgi:hypothetical protein